MERARIIRIGNSQGIRIPKPLLRQAGLGEEVELQAQPGQIVIRAASRPRHDWDAQFSAMAEQGDDHLLDSEASNLTSWDEHEWEW